MLFQKLFLVTLFAGIIGSNNDPNFSFDNNTHHFNWNDAFGLMSYHRDKMNEYLCKNYVASEIIERFNNRTENVDKRSGKPTKKPRLAKEYFMEDEGSQKYKDWLSRSSTLEDIYRQFEHSEGQGTHHDADSEHEGEVTGYALVGHKNPKPVEYGGVDHHYVVSHPIDYHDDGDEYEEKKFKLKELFHFALTAIAFLAFACFMIEVIMCLMEVPQQVEPDYVLVPTNTAVTGPASKAEANSSEVYRQGKSLDREHLPLQTLNIIASKALSITQGLTNLHENNGECLKRALCQSNKYAGSLSGMQKIWLPIWSLGTSWIAGNLAKKHQLSTDVSTLAYLKAAVVGIGSHKCDVLYPKCNTRNGKKQE